MKNKLTAIILFLFVSITVNSQVTDSTYIVHLDRKLRGPCFGDLIELQVVQNCSFLKNIPDIKCDTFAIFNFKMNQLVKTDSIPNQMYLFVGVNERKKEKYVVVDANNNHDFSDDRLFTFSLPDKPLTREEIEKRAVGLQITPDPQKSDTVNIGIDPFNYFQLTYNFQQDERLKVIICFPEYMNAKTQIGGIPVEINGYLVPNLFKRDLDEKTGFNVIFNDKANTLTWKNLFVKKTIQINDKLFELSKIESPNTIYLKETGALADSSYVGTFLPIVNANDINKDNPVSINDLIKNKYVFIDFWGSWCRPCLQAIPELKSLYEKIRDRKDVLLLGVAKEDNKDTNKLKDIISREKVEWLNLWLDSKEANRDTSIIKKLNILAYPTFLIIDNTGKIVSKDSKESIAFFLDLINK